VITLYTGPDECRAQLPGPYVGGPLGGSFVTYVCDRKSGHTYPRGHCDSVADVWWSDVDAGVPAALVPVGSIPTV
jgi:hypothetical protein